MEKTQSLKVKRFLRNSSKINRYIGAENILLLFTILSILYAFYTVFFGKHNIFKFIQKEQIRQKLQTEIAQIKNENMKLEKEIYFLKTDTFFIEKKAREDLGMVKEGDEVYIIPHKKTKPEGKKDRWIDRVIRKYQEFIIKK